MEMQLRSVSLVARRADVTGIKSELKGEKEREKLKEACQQFESILLAELWKKMNANARSIGGRDESDRPFGPLEDLAVEMSAEQLAKDGGSGMWRMLYEQLVVHLEEKKEED